MGTFVQDGHPPPPIGVTVHPRHRLSRGLILLWTMNQISGRRIFDASGNGNDGILETNDTLDEIEWARSDPDNSTPWSSPQLASGSGGNDDKIPASVPHKDGLIADNFSYVFRVKPAADLSTGVILSKDDTVPGFAFTRVAKDFQIAYSEAIQLTSVNFFVKNEWVHICIVFENDDTLTLYKNGVELTTVSSVGAYTDGAADLILGNIVNTDDQFVGRFREVMIFNRPLSALEVNELYQDPFGMFWDPGPIPVRFKPVVIPVIPALIQSLSRGPVSHNIYIRTTTRGSRPARTI